MRMLPEEIQKRYFVEEDLASNVLPTFIRVQHLKLILNFQRYSDAYQREKNSKNMSLFIL